MIRQKVVHRLARHERKGEIDERNDRRADKVQDKQAAVRLEVGEENGKRLFLLKFTGRHMVDSSCKYFFKVIVAQAGSACKESRPFLRKKRTVF